METLTDGENIVARKAIKNETFDCQIIWYTARRSADSFLKILKHISSQILLSRFKRFSLQVLHAINSEHYFKQQYIYFFYTIKCGDGKIYNVVYNVFCYGCI